jgi:hypothetical protein
MIGHGARAIRFIEVGDGDQRAAGRSCGGTREIGAPMSVPDLTDPQGRGHHAPP